MTITIAQYNQVIDGLRMQLQLLRAANLEVGEELKASKELNASWERAFNEQAQEKEDLGKEINALKFTIGKLDTELKFIRKQCDQLKNRNHFLRCRLARLKPRRKS